jgi:hypothetical protein
MTKEDLLLVYDRPVYKYLYTANQILNGAPDGAASYVYYLGSRWNAATWEDDAFNTNFVTDEVPAHAFWDSLFEGSGFSFSEMTKSGLPLGLDWQISSMSRSRGDFGPFLAHDPVKLTFQCIKDICKGRDPCGLYGECMNGKCVCDYCFGGYFCEYSIIESYAFTHFMEWIESGGINASYYSSVYWSESNRSKCFDFIFDLL